MKQFNNKEQEKFWSENKSYKGDISSKAIINISKRYVGNKIIDVGAGNGALIINLKKNNPNKKVIGIDIAPKNPLVKKGECTKLDFKDNEFNTLFCTDVIEHLSDKDLQKCLNEANRILKKGGYGIFSTINNEKLEHSTVTCPNCQIKFHRWGHCQIFTRNKIKNLFKSHGFKIVTIKNINLLLYSKFPHLSNIFYNLKIDKIINCLFDFNKILSFSLFNDDMIIVVKKIKNI